MPNTLHVEDFIVLGRTVPEDSKKYGKKVCMAGYSPSLRQFLRVYPLLIPTGANAKANRFKARHQYSLDLVRNPSDGRSESWRVADEKNPTSTLWDQATEVKKPKLLDLLMKRRVPCIKCLNDCKLSLGVLLLKAGEWAPLSIPRGDPNQSEEDASLFDDLAYQASLPGSEPLDPTQVKFTPRIKFSDQGSNRNLQVRKWGAFLLMGKPQYADDPDTLWKANGYKPDRDTLLVVGNMTTHRNNWLIIKLFQFDQGSDPSLFDTEEPLALGPPN